MLRLRVCLIAESKNDDFVPVHLMQEVVICICPHCTYDSLLSSKPWDALVTLT